MSTTTGNLRGDLVILKAMIAVLPAVNARISAPLGAHEPLIQTLLLHDAKLRKQAFGQSLEKIEREFEQLELPFEDLMIAAAETDATPIDEADTAAPADPVDVRGFRGTRAARHAVRFWRQRSVGTLP